MSFPEISAVLYDILAFVRSGGDLISEIESYSYPEPVAELIPYLDRVGRSKLLQEEFDALVPKEQYQYYVQAVFTLREKLLAAEGKTCIHDDNADIYALCDDCPVGGPRNNWSPKSQIFCGLSKQYSK